MARFGRAFPMPQKIQRSRAVTFDAVGTGFPTGAGYLASTTLSWSHAAAANAYLVVDVYTDRTGITSVKWGSTPMTLLASAALSVPSVGTATYARYGLAGVSGASSVNVTFSASAVWVCANSISYLNVANQTTVLGTSGYYSSTGTISQTVACPPLATVISGIAAGSANGGSSLTSLTGGNWRYNLSEINAGQPGFVYALLGVADSSATTTFSATVVNPYNTQFYQKLSTVLSPAPENR